MVHAVITEREIAETMITSHKVKETASRLGADLCGIAGVERFLEAPKGFHPRDVFQDTKSVVVIARRFPEGPFHANSPVPYTIANNIILNDVIRISCELCIELEKTGGLTAVPVPSEPYEYWDANRQEGRGILSLKHAGLLAGLGFMGRNHLLTNPTYGNRIVLGAALLDIELESDPINDRILCGKGCTICIDSCPVQAISATGVNQKLCRTHSGQINARNWFLYSCNTCRKICPHGAGKQFPHTT